MIMDVTRQGPRNSSMGTQMMKSPRRFRRATVKNALIRMQTSRRRQSDSPPTGKPYFFFVSMRLVFLAVITLTLSSVILRTEAFVARSTDMRPHHCNDIHKQQHRLFVWTQRKRSATITASYHLTTNGFTDEDDTHPHPLHSPSESQHQRSPLRRKILVALSVPFWTQLVPSEAYGLISGEPSSENASSAKTSSSTTELIYNLLHPVPTFCITLDGIPYFVVGEDAKLTSYFFTTWGEADRILTLAKRTSDKALKDAKNDPTLSAEEKSELGDNPWTDAKITTVSLDTAVTLVSKSTKSLYFKISPSVDDVNDALAVSKQDDLQEGKVPLFYYENFTIPVSTSVGSSDTQLQRMKTPLYFRKSELIDAYNKQKKRQAGDFTARDTMVDNPDIKVTELFAVLQEMLKAPPKTGDDHDGDDIWNLVLVPPKESAAKQQECLRLGKRSSGSKQKTTGGMQQQQKQEQGIPQFVVGQRIIVL